MWQNLFAIINSMDKDKNLKNENKDSNMDAQALQEQGNKANPSNVNTKPQSADEHTNTESANGSNNSTSNSNTFQLDLAVLNEVSKIAKMGMDSISYLAPKVSDKEMRKVLVAMKVEQRGKEFREGILIKFNSMCQTLQCKSASSPKLRNCFPNWTPAWRN